MNIDRSSRPNYHKLFILILGVLVLVYIGLILYGILLCTDPLSTNVETLDTNITTTCSRFLDDSRLIVQQIVPVVVIGYLLFLLLEWLFDLVFLPSGLPARGAGRLTIDLILLLISVSIVYWGMRQLIDLLALG